ncbi:MAG: DUF3696 domain-containing protein [Crenarchaeota archaeon]|nr:DUF3696 domain-containing protein [Thermoproteota archaeon]
MITKITVEKYACIEKGEIELKPVTILIGDNASGKTMIINALLQLVDLIIDSRFARIPLEEVVRETPEHTTISITFEKGLTINNIIELFSTIVAELMSNKMLEIPEQEVLVSKVRDIIQSYDKDFEKIIYNLIEILKNTLTDTELTEEEKILHILTLSSEIALSSTSQARDRKTVKKIILTVLLLTIGLDISNIFELLSKIDTCFNEKISITLNLQKRSKETIVLEGSIHLDRLRISIILREGAVELVVYGKKFIIKNYSFSNNSRVAKNIFKQSKTSRLILYWIYDDLWSSWEPDAKPKSLIFIPGFRFEPCIYIPYFELRSRVERFPVSDLYVAQMYDEEDLEGLANALGCDSFNDLLRRYFDIDDLELQEIPDVGIRIVVRRGLLKSTIAASGSGTYYILPIVIACSMSYMNSVIIIEHPELYLNPSYQARLMDFLIDLTKRRKCRVVLETHSPFMIYRVMRRVAEGKIEPCEVSIYYFKLNKEKGFTNITSIDLDENGVPKLWPEGLFEEDLEDALTIIHMIARKRR